LAYFFPLDLAVVGFVVLYLLACTLYGMSHVGVRVLCIRTHTLRPRRTSTRGVLFMVVNIVFAMVASTAQLMYIMPQYATFGAQTYVDVRTNELSTCTMMGAVGVQDSFSGELPGVHANGKKEEGHNEGIQVHGKPASSTTTPTPTTTMAASSATTTTTAAAPKPPTAGRRLLSILDAPHDRRRIQPDTSKGNTEDSSKKEQLESKNMVSLPSNAGKTTKAASPKATAPKATAPKAAATKEVAIKTDTETSMALPTTWGDGTVTDNSIEKDTSGNSGNSDNNNNDDDDDGISELEAYMNVLESGNYTNGTIVGDCNPTEMSIMFNNVAVHYPVFGALLQWMTVVYVILCAVYFYVASCRSRMTIYCIDFEKDYHGIAISDDEDEEGSGFLEEEEEEGDFWEETEVVNINGRR